MMAIGRQVVWTFPIARQPWKICPPDLVRNFDILFALLAAIRAVSRSQTLAPACGFVSLYYACCWFLNG